MADNVPQERWLKSGSVSLASNSKVDSENGIIHGVVLCQIGEAKGHNIHLEESFIEDCLAYADKHYTKLGLKCRFGHPSMSNETLGTEMGRFSNFSVSNNRLIADLNLLESSNISPTNPGMRDWMLSMAKEDPKMIMCSIVFTVDHYYQYNDKGEKVRVWEYDKDGKFISANGKMKVYVALKELLFCDIVDQGAVTDKLFSESLNSDKFAVVASRFLEENPALDEFIKQNPHKLLKFLEQRSEGSNSKPFNVIDWISEKLSIGKHRESQIDSERSETNKQNTQMDFSKSLEILKKENPSSNELAEVVNEIEAFTGENEKFSKAELDIAVQSALANHGQELEQAESKIKSLESKVAELGQESPTPEPTKIEGQEQLQSTETTEKKFEEWDHNKEAIKEIENL